MQTCLRTGCLDLQRFGLYRRTSRSITKVRASSQHRSAASKAGSAPSEYFQYNSGRWIFNESDRLSERHLWFDTRELAKVAAIITGRSADAVRSIHKVAEGGFNRIFRLTMKDGLRIIARVPYPSTQPKRLSVASEVATMELVRRYGVPAPKIYGYSADSSNPVGAEYILMEDVAGEVLGDRWFTLSDRQRLTVLSEIVENEAKLFDIDFPAYGSLYYGQDLPSNMVGKHFSARSTDDLCVGPDASSKFWFKERSSLDIYRGPCYTPTEVLQLAANKELAWLRTYAKPRFPFDRVYRDITNYQKSDPEKHIRSLRLFADIIGYLVPKEGWLHKPMLRHPDLNPNNIFVDKDFKITAIIDWQHAVILPLFLHAGIPAHIQNYGDPVSEELIKPDLGPHFDELDERERRADLELYRRRHLHFYYVGATAKKFEPHFQALMYNGGLFRRRIYQHAAEPWEGNNIPLKADLTRLCRQWSTLVSQDGADVSSAPECPFAIDPSEAERTTQAMMRQEEADGHVEVVRNAIGIGVDGWVSNEGYEEAVAQAAAFKARALEDADDDAERELILRHWPWDDHDEDE